METQNVKLSPSHNLQTEIMDNKAQNILTKQYQLAKEDITNKNGDKKIQQNIKNLILKIIELIESVSIAEYESKSPMMIILLNNQSACLMKYSLKDLKIEVDQKITDVRNLVSNREILLDFVINTNKASWLFFQKKYKTCIKICFENCKVIEELVYAEKNSSKKSNHLKQNEEKLQALFLLVINYYLTAISMFFVDSSFLENFLDSGQLSSKTLLIKAKDLAEENFPKKIFLIDFDKMIKLSRKENKSITNFKKDDKKYRISKKPKISYNAHNNSHKETIKRVKTSTSDEKNFQKNKHESINFTNIDKNVSFAKKGLYQPQVISKKSTESKNDFCIKTKKTLQSNASRNCLTSRNDKNNQDLSTDQNSATFRKFDQGKDSADDINNSHVYKYQVDFNTFQKKSQENLNIENKLTQSSPQENNIFVKQSDENFKDIGIKQDQISAFNKNGSLQIYFNPNINISPNNKFEEFQNSNNSNSIFKTENSDQNKHVKILKHISTNTEEDTQNILTSEKKSESSPNKNATSLFLTNPLPVSENFFPSQLLSKISNNDKKFDVNDKSVISEPINALSIANILDLLNSSFKKNVVPDKIDSSNETDKIYQKNLQLFMNPI